MSTKEKVLENLQTALSMELAAVNQYMLHALVADDWGLTKLAAQMREEMSEELGHAQQYAERIIFLNGDPKLEPEKVPARAQALKDMFEADLRDEKDAIKFYTQAAHAAAEAGDIGTRKLFENTALDEEGHMSWLELQISLIERMGEPTYIAMHVGDPEGQEEA